MTVGVGEGEALERPRPQEADIIGIDARAIAWGEDVGSNTATTIDRAPQTGVVACGVGAADAVGRIEFAVQVAVFDVLGIGLVALGVALLYATSRGGVVASDR